MADLFTDSLSYAPVSLQEQSVPSISSPIGGPIDELDMPQTVSYSGSGSNSGPRKPQTFEESMAFLEKATAAKNPFYGTGSTTPNTASYKQARKYLNEEQGFMYGTDNEDFYAQRQSGLTKLGTGLLELPLLTVAKTGQGIGFIGSLFNPDNMFSDEGYFAAATDNAFSNAFASMEDKMKNEWGWSKTFQEEEDREKGFWRRAFTDANFWSDDFVDGLAFMGSAYLPGTALSKLSVGMKIAKGLSRLGIGAEAAGAAIEGLETVPNYLKNAQALATKWDRGVTWATATASEAMQEAKGVKDSLTLSLENSGLSDEDKKEIIGTNTRNTFLLNSALLGVTNFMELKYLYKTFGKAEGVAGRISQSKLGQMFETPLVAPAVSRLDKLLQSPARTFITGGIGGVLREGFVEENAQLAIQRFNETNGAAGAVTSLFDIVGLGSQYFKQTAAAILGNDPEASTSIGLGGILGGVPGGVGDMRQAKADKVTTDSAITALNLSQQSWLKYGNIYKTETVDKIGPDGKATKQEQILLDENKKPVIDDGKINAITANFKANVDLLDQADKTNDKLKQSVLRDKAFANFVTAHVSAGIEDDLFSKLDSAISAKPEDLINLGFDPSQDYKQQIQDYKNLATDIIKQNKLISNSLLLDGSPEDDTRKGVLLDMAATQSIYKKMANQVSNEGLDIQNELAKTKNSSLTDGLVDQLNTLQFRIDSMKEVLEKRKGNKIQTPLRDGLYNDVLLELEEAKKELLEENETSVKTLKKKGEFYDYEKKDRVKDPLNKAFNDKLRLQGQIENEVRTDALQIGKIADALKGKENYKNYINESVVPMANQALKAAERERTKAEVPNLNDIPDVKQEPLGDAYIIDFETPEGNKEMELQEGMVFAKKDGKKTLTLKIVKFEEEGEKVKINLNGKEAVTTSETVARLLTLETGWELQENKQPVKPKGNQKTKKEIGDDLTDDNEEGEDIKEDEEDDGLEDDGTEDGQEVRDTIDRGPKWEDVKFNKTFGRQYIDKKDVVMNTSEGTDRFYRFTSKHNMANRFYALEVVTKDNDKFGIRTKGFPNDIKVIVTKSTKLDTGEIIYEYVDENNNIIPEGKATKDNIIYRSLADVNEWTPERVRESYSVDKLTLDEEIQADIDEHKEWQDSLVEMAKDGDALYLNVVRTSPGVTKIEYTSATDEKGKRVMAQNNLEGRLILEEPDWKDVKSINNPDNNITLRIATAKGNIPGIKPGHLVMQEFTYDDNSNKRWGDKVTKVFNRKLSKEEQGLIISALVRRSDFDVKIFGSNSFGPKKKRGKLSDEEQLEYDLIYNYLKGVINWSQPKKGQNTSNHVWIKNGLHVGTTVVKFLKKDILAKKDDLFKNKYHNVNNTLLNANEEFTDIKIVNNKVVAGKVYDTYQQYLLEQRKGDDVPPVYTSMPLYDASTPQRTGVYIIWKDTDAETSEDENEEVEEKDEVLQYRRMKMPVLDKDINDFVAGKKKIITINGAKFGLNVNTNGSVTIYVKPAKGTEKSKTIPSLEEFQKRMPDFIKEIKSITGYTYGMMSQVSEEFIKSTREEKKKAIAAGKNKDKKQDFFAGKNQARDIADDQYMNNLFQQFVDGKPIAEFTATEQAFLENPMMKAAYGKVTPSTNKKEPKKKQKPDTDPNADVEDGPFFSIDDAIDNAVLVNGFLVATVHTVNAITNEVKESMKARWPSQDRNEKAKNTLRKMLIQQVQDSVDEEPPFRKAFAAQEDVTRFEDFDKLKDFIGTNLPQWDVQKFSHLINGKAWGAFQNSSLYIYENAAYGTGFHEAFEGVWKHYLTDPERMELANEFRNREGSFTNPFSNETKNYSEATMYDVREMLAEQFIGFIENDGASDTIQTKARSFFQKLWDLIRQLFGLSTIQREELDNKINQVYKKISTGGFANVKTIQEKDLSETEYRAVPGFTQKQTADIMEGLMYEFFIGLYKQGANIDTLLNSMSKADSNKLLNALYGTAYDMTSANLALINPKLQTTLSQQRQAVYERFKQLLGKYGAVFSEVEVDEDKVTDTLGIRDSISVNPKSLTSTNVMMLLASLPYRILNSKTGKYPVARNDMNQPKLVNADRIHTMLLNELSNIVTHYNTNGVKVDAFTQMMETLDKKYKLKNGTYKDGYAWIISLQQRLKFKNATGQKIPYTELTQDDIFLRVSFTKSFSNIKYQPEKLIISEEGAIYSTNPLVNVNQDRIRKDWANNLKVRVQNRTTKLFYIDKTGQMVVNRSSGEFLDLMTYVDNPEQFDNADKSVNMDTVLYVLDKLGMKFSANADDLSEYAMTMREQAVQILNVLFKDEITNVAELYAKDIIGGRINALLNIEAAFSSEENILTYLNGDGEMQYSVGISSLYGNMINILNSVKSLEELLQTCPWLGYIENGETFMYPYQESCELLKKGGTLFDKSGKRKKGAKLKYHVLAGTGISDVDGVNTSKLQFPERIAFKMHYLMNNVAFSVINSDKSQEFGIGIPEKNTVFIGMDNINKFLNGKDDKIVNKYLAQLGDEMAAAEAQQVDPVNIQYYKDDVYDLGHFRDIIGKELIKKFNEEVLTDTDLTISEFIEENREILTKKITDYIQEQIDQTVKMLKKEDIFFKPEVKNAFFGSNEYLVTDALDNEQLNSLLKVGDRQNIKFYKQDGVGGNHLDRSGYSENNIRAIAAYVNINEELMTAEQHKLIYGHPAMYKDLPKRANGATSTKEPIVEDAEVINWMDDNMKRLDGKLRSIQQHQTFKNISYKDVDIVSLFYKDMAEGMYADLLDNGMTAKVAADKVGGVFNKQGEIIGYKKDKDGKYTGAISVYLKLTEADAMAWVMPDMTRDLLFLSSKFDSRRDAQWNYEVAYEKLVRSGYMPNKDGQTIKKGDPRHKKFDLAEINAADAIYKKGDPGYQFEVLKTQYFGYSKTDNVTHPAFLKHSIQPKFYRHVEGSQFENMYLAAQNDNVDLIGFESGQKVGNVTTDEGSFVPVYTNTGSVNIQNKNNQYSFPQEVPKQDLYTRFYGIQVEQNSKPKKYNVRGSQVTKVVMTNFFENGKPLNGDKKLNKLITDYNKTLINMIKLGKENLLKEIGLEKSKDGYKTKDLSRLVKLLRKEAESRDLPENMVDAINAVELADGTQELQYQFDTLINRDKIDNILNSIVDSRVISEKIHGKSSVQVASTLYESNPRDFVYLKDGVYQPLSKNTLSKLSDEDRKTVRMASNDLKFYRNENGKITSMEAYVNWPFVGITPEELGLKLENGVYKIPAGGVKGLDSNLLKAIGFRIPTQAPNSIESITIKGFTPAANGDMIVVPSEIVGKSGSDFDIDKLNLYLPVYRIEHDAYGTESFKQFMIDDLVKRGHSKAVATGWLKKMSVADIRTINEATFTEAGKERHKAENSLVDLNGKIADASSEQLQKIKNSIQNFNIQYRGQKRVEYIQPDDTTTAGLQNKFMELTNNLITHPLNYGQLVSPNSTAELKGLATEIKNRKLAAGTKVKENEKSPTYLRSFVGSVITRERYLTAKRMVGIAALHTTFHAMAQVAGTKMNSEFKMSSLYYLIPKKTKKKGKKVEVTAATKVEQIKIKLDHKDANEDGTFSLGHRNDTDSIKISDSFSEATSGFVDGAKDPFVFDLNFSLQSASTWFYLKHHGVPERQVAYFMNQPIIDQYLAVQAKNKSSFKKINDEQLTREEMMYEVIAPWYYMATGKDIKTLLATARNTANELTLKNETTTALNMVYDSYSKFDIDTMEEAISKGGNADPNMQLAVLMSYLRYEAQASKLTDYIIAIGYDTAKTKTVQETFQQSAKWNRVTESSFIENPEAMMDNTFLGELKKQKEDVPILFNKFFISLTPEVQKVFKPLYDKLDNPDYFIMKEDALNLLNRYQNHVLNYILHTTKFTDRDGKQKVLNSMYKEMFFGDNSMAKRLYELKNSDDTDIADNLFIKELLPMITDNNTKTNNVSLFRSRMDTFDINSIIEALNDLREYGKKIADVELVKFTDDITKFSILQSGVQSSGIDYKKVLSTELYSELIKTIFTSFKRKPDLDVNQVWRTFHQNNWTNRTIVTKAPGWVKLEDGALPISIFSSASEKDFYLKYVRDPKITNEKAKALKAAGKGQEIWIPRLFQRTEYTDVTGTKILYFPIDTLGDGRNFTEIYTDVEQDSVLAKNKMKDMTKDKTVLNGSGGWVDVSSEKMRNISERYGNPVYLGGKSGFSPAGKGTAEGDGKDKAMRKKADAVIVEMVDDPSYAVGEESYQVDKDMLGRSSSETSLIQVSAKNEGLITKKGKTFSSIATKSTVIMLARNSEYKGRPLLPQTKKLIMDAAGSENVTFLVGDMPNVDSQFVDYLQTIGATYDVYYTGTEPRFSPVKQSKTDKKAQTGTSFEELFTDLKKNTKANKQELTYDVYKESAKEKKEEPITKRFFDKLTLREKEHLFNQLKNC